MTLSTFFITWIATGIISHLLFFASDVIFNLRSRVYGRKMNLEFDMLYKHITARVLMGYISFSIALVTIIFILVLPNKYIRNRAQNEKAKRTNKMRTDINIPRIEVSAALDLLVNSDVEPIEAMKKVILFSQTLKEAEPFELRTGLKKSKRDDNIITGHTAEQGNVSTRINDEGDSREDPFSLYKERVGLFRIWLVYDDLIGFHHFWSSDENTSVPESVGGSRPDIYYIEFDIKTLKPRCLAINAPKALFNIFGVTLYRIELEPLWGTLKNPKSHAGYGIY